MSQYVLTPQADQDLVDIWEYIAQDDIEAADRWDANLREAFQMLARNPRVGHSRKDLSDHPFCSGRWERTSLSIELWRTRLRS